MKHFCLTIILSFTSLLGHAACSDWPDWNAFKAALLEEGGRIVDSSDPRRITTSEGQSYAMFFALVAGDKATFERLRSWTENNLAEGDMTRRLPAWLWGQKPDGSWGTLDDNAASDADLWIAYSLLEAGRLWREPRYTASGILLQKQILQREVVDLPGLGFTLLPAPFGFQLAPDAWRLNPSYMPLPLLRKFATREPASRWPGVLASTARILVESSPKGYAPDWIRYRAKQGFDGGADGATLGSYDAIRVYLWLGLSHATDPLSTPLRTHFQPLANWLEQSAKQDSIPPERIQTRDGSVVSANGPIGFSMALLPYLQLYGASAALAAQRRRYVQSPPAAGEYYNRVLTLFGMGADEGRYQFAADGSLVPRWPCTSAK